VLTAESEVIGSEAAWLRYELAHRRAVGLAQSGQPVEALRAAQEAVSNWAFVRSEFIRPDGTYDVDAHRRTTLAQIADAADVSLRTVTVHFPADALRDAVAAGLDRLGENRVQEGLAKAPDVPGAHWQLVGPLQSNKARRALEVFESIQTVDSLDLARRLDRLVPETRAGGRYPVLVQVNVDLDATKAGFAPDAIPTAMGELLALPHLAVRGLMTVGRLTDDPAVARRTFSALRQLSERTRSRWPELGPELSMGMSDDFETAVEEGSSMVRLGRILFGQR
jgi:pyridoxal phosphate enzyme (YggS family)